jgi:hypothetical protein
LILGDYDTPSSQLAPTLLAWAPGVAEPITVDGGSPRLDKQNAIVVPLAISQVSAGPLPVGFFAPRLVDATGQVGLSQYGAAVDNGSVTYEFSLPLAAGTHVSGLKITHLLAAGPFPPTGLVGAERTTCSDERGLGLVAIDVGGDFACEQRHRPAPERIFAARHRIGAPPARLGRRGELPGGIALAGGDGQSGELSTRANGRPDGKSIR